jgi:hypothetical protein
LAGHSVDAGGVGDGLFDCLRSDCLASVAGEVVVEGLADDLGGAAALLRGEIFEAHDAAAFGLDVLQ